MQVKAGRQRQNFRSTGCPKLPPSTLANGPNQQEAILPPQPGGAGKEEGLWKPKGSRPPSTQLRTWKHGAAMSGETPKGLLPCSRKALGRHCWLRVENSKGQSGPFTAGASRSSLGRLNVASGLFGTQSIFLGDMAVSRWPQPGWFSHAGLPGQ